MVATSNGRSSMYATPTRPTIRYEYEPHNAVKRTLAAFGRDVVPRELLAPANDAPIAGLAA